MSYCASICLNHLKQYLILNLELDQWPRGSSYLPPITIKSSEFHALPQVLPHSAFYAGSEDSLRFPHSKHQVQLPTESSLQLHRCIFSPSLSLPIFSCCMNQNCLSVQTNLNVSLLCVVPSKSLETQLMEQREGRQYINKAGLVPQTQAVETNAVCCVFHLLGYP